MQTAVKHNGTDTSRQAAESIKADVASIRRKVYRLIESFGSDGLTCDELEDLTGMSHQTASARFSELNQAAWIADSGKRRRTRSGRPARVYVAIKQEAANA